MKVREEVKKLKPYVPGKSKEEIIKRYGVKRIIKLGSNENPWGASPKVKERIIKELDRIHEYPEPINEELLEELENFLGVSKENIIVGGDGADEVLDILFKTFVDKGDEVIIPIPTFTQYRVLAQIYGAKIRFGKFDKEREFKLDVDSVLENISEKTKLIFLCSPNNPTGNLIDDEAIKEIVESTEALVVIDHAYIEYSSRGDWTRKIEKYNNILILRTFSKVFGLAGLRVGYGVANEEIINYMLRVKPAFSLTRLSQVAAIEALRDKEFFNKCVKDGIKSRELLYKGLKEFEELKVYPSEANYVLVELKTMSSKEFCEELLKRGVIVRDCSSFDGLGENYVRISIGTFEEIKEFLDILRDIFR
ncbi:histidinol-phosphate aminotransferase [Methanocaldococcus infernus ME]|uniref:Histidinol-phosphate aminotransferase n=1 Tax=Methanocaldococcus infernus (strain DSM 11812 / JCM 15783 / ME) TaxID=573063 RepID=D5VRI8_METIM|nr:histidinol-phosphate transaminase [Methanocaldococcus infernus]ADG13191.1 histidinol-phosphate aminotransferase [Methanocaldococcus infernus ME]